MLIIFNFHLSIYFFNHPENLDLKKNWTVMAGYGVVLGGFSRNKKTRKTQKVVEDYNNGNNVFLFFIY